MCRIELRNGRYYVLVKNYEGIEFPIMTTPRKDEAELMKRYYDESKTK